MDDIQNFDIIPEKKEKYRFTDNIDIPEAFYETLGNALASSVEQPEYLFYHDTPKYRLGVYTGTLTSDSQDWGKLYKLAELPKVFFKSSYVSSDDYAKRLMKLLEQHSVTTFTCLDVGAWNCISIRVKNRYFTFIDSPFRVSNAQLERQALLDDAPKGSSRQSASDAIAAWKKKRGF